jgi:hypothetical protein
MARGQVEVTNTLDGLVFFSPIILIIPKVTLGRIIDGGRVIRWTTLST